MGDDFLKTVKTMFTVAGSKVYRKGEVIYVDDDSFVATDSYRIASDIILDPVFDSEFYKTQCKKHSKKLERFKKS